jgi:hypothetical protein
VSTPFISACCVCFCAPGNDPNTALRCAVTLSATGSFKRRSANLDQQQPKNSQPAVAEEAAGGAQQQQPDAGKATLAGPVRVRGHGRGQPVMKARIGRGAP